MSVYCCLTADLCTIMFLDFRHGFVVSWLDKILLSYYYHANIKQSLIETDYHGWVQEGSRVLEDWCCPFPWVASVSVLNFIPNSVILMNALLICMAHSDLLINGEFKYTSLVIPHLYPPFRCLRVLGFTLICEGGHENDISNWHICFRWVYTLR